MNLTQPHEPTDRCAGVHCYIHGVDEPGPAYIACLECGHAYRTAADLRRAYRRTMRQVSTPWEMLPRLFRRARNISFCPECAHDW